MAITSKQLKFNQATKDVVFGKKIILTANLIATKGSSSGNNISVTLKDKTLSVLGKSIGTTTINLSYIEKQTYSKNAPKFDKKGKYTNGDTWTDKTSHKKINGKIQVTRTFTLSRKININPPPPKNLRIRQKVNNMLINFDKSKRAEEYELQIKRVGGNFITLNSSLKKTSYTWKSAIVGVDYIVRVRAKKGSNVSSWCTLAFKFKNMEIQGGYYNSYSSPLPEPANYELIEFEGLDENFMPVKSVKYKECSWHRKYLECGEFLISVNDWDMNIKYLYTKDREEMGQINKIEFLNENGIKTYTISGFFMENVLNDRIIGTLNSNGNFIKYSNKSKNYEYFITFLKGIYENYLQNNNIPNGKELKWVTSYEAPTTPSASEDDRFIYASVKGENVATYFYTILSVQEYSFKVRYDYINDNFTLDIFQGKDRTEEQAENNIVTFSDEFMNILNLTYTKDNSNYKNYAIIEGTDDETSENNTKYYYNACQIGTGYKKELFVEAEEKYSTLEFINVEKYKNKYLKQQGFNKLNNEYYLIENIEFSNSQTGYKYLKDFNIGDKVQIELKELGVSFTARITEILEEIKENKNNITITVGEPTLRR